MTDIVDKATRSRMMSGIRGKDTIPEMVIRRGLHKYGFRFRLHDKTLPGKPDLVLRKYNAVIFINGCFWHKHECRLFKWPKTRSEFWRKKLNRNRENDERAIKVLITSGWRVCVAWECAVKGKNSKEISELIDRIGKWLTSGRGKLIIPSNMQS